MNQGLVELTFPARAQYLALARLSLAGIAPVAKLDPDAVADLKLAVTEACSNVVRHAYPDRIGDVRLRVAVEDGMLTVEVSDDGTGVDASRLRTWEPDMLRAHGMGLAIMRSVVDEVEIGSPPSGGTTVRLVKRLSARP